LVDHRTWRHLAQHSAWRWTGDCAYLPDPGWFAGDGRHCEHLVE